MQKISWGHSVASTSTRATNATLYCRTWVYTPQDSFSMEGWPDGSPARSTRTCLGDGVFPGFVRGRIRGPLPARPIVGETGGRPNHSLFTGEQRDADSEMYYLRARYYD